MKRTLGLWMTAGGVAALTACVSIARIGTTDALIPVAIAVLTNVGFYAASPKARASLARHGRLAAAALAFALVCLLVVLLTSTAVVTTTAGIGALVVVAVLAAIAAARGGALEHGAPARPSSADAG